MTETIPALSRLLLPVRDTDHFRKVMPFLQVVSRSMQDTLEKVDLLHVVGGSFLSTHLENIDFRAGHVLSSDLMKRLRRQHHKEWVDPLLAEVQAILRTEGVELPVEIRVEDGDPAKKISLISNEGRYSTLLMARRKMPADNSLGTVVNGVLNRHLETSLYLVGEDGFPEGKSPVSRVVIGVDGSPSCFEAVREAALLICRNIDEVNEVTLVNVRDPACFFDDKGVDCKKESDKGYGYLKEAEELLIREGVDESRITTMLLFGHPGETLTEFVESSGATMCYIGRRDRLKIAEVLLGSVCGDVVHRCRKAALVLVG